MSYRPQFAYAPVEQSEVFFDYSFNALSTPALVGPVKAGALLYNVVLQMQNDAEFACRGIKVQLGTAPSNLYLWIKDPFGNYLSQVPVPLSLYLTGAGNLAGITGSLVVPIEPEIVCPAGGFWEVFFYNPTGGNLTPPAFTFLGEKRCLERAQ